MLVVLFCLLPTGFVRFVSRCFPVAFWVFCCDNAWSQSHFGLVPCVTGSAFAPQATEPEFTKPLGLNDGLDVRGRQTSGRVVHPTCDVLDECGSECLPPTLQWFPNGLIYRSYLGSVRESRFACVLTKDKNQGWLWDVSLGGRVGIVRYGCGPNFWPDGWQLDIEGAAFPRLDPWAVSTPLLSTDFRFGIPITYGQGPWRFKTGYYHLSSHLGDEFLLANPEVERYNYSRDALILAVSYYFGHSPLGRYDWRCYGEVTWADWAESRGGVAEPWELLFGLEYSPAFEFQRGAPFAAINAHLREEARFGGHFSLQAGWQLLRGPSGSLFRLGGEYVNGKSTQGSFFREFEKRIGVGMWYDF